MSGRPIHMKKTKKRFSLRRHIKSLEAAVMRFPLASACAVAITAVGITLIHIDGSEDPYIKLLLVLFLALPVFVCLQLVRERAGWKPSEWMAASVAAGATLGAYYSWLPLPTDSEVMWMFVRHGIWVGAAILLIAIIAFHKKGDTPIAFWKYDKTLAFSFILTLIWSWLIHGGVAIAFASADFLFEFIDLAPERYEELGVLVYGLFAPIFFLSRIPTDWEALRNLGTYPKELRLLAQWVLVPLTTVYFVILYAYTIKIVGTQEWPEGQLAYMILGFSFVGVLTYLILYPLREKIAWIRKSGNVFFAAVIPQVAMLFAALWFRVSEYAWTESRYFVFVFGCWLFAIAVYMLHSKAKDIRLIPATFCLVALLGTFGPWGAFSVSEASQVNRLEGILASNEILVDGSVQEAETELSKEDLGEISAILRYLNEMHGLESIQPWFDESIDDLTLKEITDLMGAEYVSYSPRDKESGYINIYTNLFNTCSVFDLEGYDHLVMLEWSSNEFDVDGATYQFDVDEPSASLVLTEGDREIASVPLAEFLEDTGNEGHQLIDSESSGLEFENDEIDLVLYFHNLSGELTEDGFETYNLAGFMLFTLK